jgi:hypothetical protein
MRDNFHWNAEVVHLMTADSFIPHTCWVMLHLLGLCFGGGAFHGNKVMHSTTKKVW